MTDVVSVNFKRFINNCYDRHMNHSIGNSIGVVTVSLTLCLYNSPYMLVEYYHTCIQW